MPKLKAKMVLSFCSFKNLLKSFLSSNEISPRWSNISKFLKDWLCCNQSKGTTTIRPGSKSGEGRASFVITISILFFSPNFSTIMSSRFSVFFCLVHIFFINPFSSKRFFMKIVSWLGLIISSVTSLKINGMESKLDES